MQYQDRQIATTTLGQSVYPHIALHISNYYIIISVSREKPCETCYKKHKKIEWDILHPLAPVERQLTTAKSTAYRNPVPNQEYVFNSICLCVFVAI